MLYLSSSRPAAIIRLIIVSLLFFFTSKILPTAQAEILQLTDSNFDSVLSAFPSSRFLVLFTSSTCIHCTRMQDEYETLSTDQHVKDAKVVVASVNGPRNGNLSLRFGVRSYPTLLYLRDGRMFTYDGEKKAQHMRSFVLKGYENQAEGEAIPPRITMRNRLGVYFKAAWGELGDAARGDMGMVGYSMVLLTGFVLGLVGMVIFVAVVVARRKLKEG